MDSSLLSKTYKVYVGCGHVYVTVDFKEGALYRVRINRNSKDLKCPFTAIETINRNATYKARRDPRQLVKDEIGSERHACDAFTVAVKARIKRGELAAYSCSDAVARCLLREGVKID